MQTWKRGVCGGAVVTACALLVSTAAAQQRPAHSPPAQRSLDQVLTLEPGASCLERTRLLAHVKMWLGGDRVEPSVRIRVHGDPADRRKLWFELERDGQASRRSFEPAPDSCDDTHAVLGLSIAMAIDAERLRDTLAPLPAPPCLRLLSLQPSLAYDVLPGASLGALLGGELGLLPWFGLRADALAHYSWDDTISGSTGHFDALLVAVAPSAITGRPSTLLVGVATFTPESTYQSSTVPNAPPPSGMIAIAGNAALTQTITFSVPVRDPLIAVMSLGNFGMASTWQFDATPVVLSTGPGILDQNGTLTVTGDALTGVEGYGVVELAGTFSAISFSVPTPESTALFTVGIRGRE